MCMCVHCVLRVCVRGAVVRACAHMCVRVRACIMKGMHITYDCKKTHNNRRLNQTIAFLQAASQPAPRTPIRGQPPGAPADEQVHCSACVCGMHALCSHVFVCAYACSCASVCAPVCECECVHHGQCPYVTERECASIIYIYMHACMCACACMYMCACVRANRTCLVVVSYCVVFCARRPT